MDSDDCGEIEKKAREEHRNKVNLQILKNWVHWCSIQKREQTPQTTFGHRVYKNKIVRNLSVVISTSLLSPTHPVYSLQCLKVQSFHT